VGLVSSRTLGVLEVLFMHICLMRAGFAVLGSVVLLSLSGGQGSKSVSSIGGGFYKNPLPVLLACTAASAPGWVPTSQNCTSK
jgi:hypothetical protein